jgi:hypothetical protein
MSVNDRLCFWSAQLGRGQRVNKRLQQFVDDHRQPLPSNYER